MENSWRNVYVHVSRAGNREVAVELALSGFASVPEARVALVERLKEDGTDGDMAGVVVAVEENPNSISVETTTCGFGISNDDIERAIAAQGRCVVC